MNRRSSILVLAASAVARVPSASAENTAIPTVAFFRSSAAAPFTGIVAAFRQGLARGGLVEGQDVEVDYRWANNQLERLPEIAADLARRGVAVIVGNSVAVEAARKATKTIPIVFVAADDPVKSGLVGSLNRPGGNLTGVTFFAGGQLGAKRVELLLEMVPSARLVGVLSDPSYPASAIELPAIEAAVVEVGRRVVSAEAASESAFEPALDMLAAGGAEVLFVGGSPLFTGKRNALVPLVARFALPAIYDQRDQVDAGGLISYGASFTDAYRQAGEYAAAIVRGADPAELPVLQPTEFELAVNLKTAGALGLEVPESILRRADHVIE